MIYEGKNAVLKIRDEKGNFKEVGSFNCTMKKKPEIDEDLFLGTKGIRDHHFGEVSTVQEVINDILNSHAYCRCIGDTINFKEENKMYKDDLDLLLGEKENIIMDLNIMKFTKRGFIVKLKLDNKSKKEFVEYGEDVGQHISNLIHDFIDEIEDEQRKEEEIEWVKGKINRNKERLAELKEGK